VVRRRQRGYSLIEMLVSTAVLCGIVVLFAILTAEMRDQQERMPINFMKHPQVSAVLARMRRDVLDAYGSQPYEPERTYGYEQTPQTLIIESVQPNGGVQTIVWDFRETGIVRRRAFNVGVETQWVARGLPANFQCAIGAVEDIPGDAPVAVRITALDEEGRIAIDQILQPRAHD
jgi:prepilin-type N-terminal cleavage/methylation domain-containing protein